MFRKKDEPTPNLEPMPSTSRVTSIIGEGTSWKGEISGSGGIRIEGLYEGEIDFLHCRVRHRQVLFHQVQESSSGLVDPPQVLEKGGTGTVLQIFLQHLGVPENMSHGVPEIVAERREAARER